MLRRQLASPMRERRNVVLDIRDIHFRKDGRMFEMTVISWLEM